MAAYLSILCWTCHHLVSVDGGIGDTAQQPTANYLPFYLPELQPTATIPATSDYLPVSVFLFCGIGTSYATTHTARAMTSYHIATAMAATGRRDHIPASGRRMAGK